MSDLKKGTRKTAFLLGLFAVCISISLVGGGLALYDRFQLTNNRRTQQQQINAKLIRSDKRQRETIRTVLCLASAEVKHRSDFTPEQKKRAVAFYREALAKIKVEPCSTGGKK